MSPAPAPAGSENSRRRRLSALMPALLLAIFLLDLALPGSISLLPYYWLPLVLSVGFASPRQIRRMAALTLVLAILSGLRWSLFTGPDYWLRLGALTGVSLICVDLARQRWRSEQQLRESEQRYRLLAENASDVVFGGNLGGVTEWITPTLTPLLGWRPEELIGQPFAPFVHPDDRELLRQADAAFGRGERQAFRLRVRQRSGDYRWVAVTARGVQGPRGEVVGLVGSWRDIQAEVEAEQAEALQRSRLAATFASLLDPHAVLQARRDASGAIVDFTYTAANEAACRYNHISCEQLVGRSLMDLLPAHESTGLLAMYRCVLETREPLVLNDFLYPHEILGEERRYDIRAVPVGDEVCFTWRDVTDRYEAARRLAASEETYRLLAQNVTDVVVRIRDDRAIWTSPSVTAAFGWRPEHWLGRRPAEFLHPEDLEAHEAALRALGRGESLVCRRRLRGRDGSWHWVDVHAGPYHDQQGDIDGLVASLRVIDAAVAAERQLERQARTDELTGLLNRREGLARLEAHTSIVKRSGERTAVLFCDLDRFKTINDQHGHAAGDQLLRTVADRVRGCLRSGDLAARVGGDELLVVLEGVRDLDSAMAVAEKIRRVTEEPVATAFGDLAISLSIGVTLALPGEDSDALIARADAAMYEAKRSGRNRVIPIPGPVG